MNVTVEAVDKGLPPRSSSLSFEVAVSAANAHSPRFASASGYAAELAESAPVGTSVLTVAAIDDDRDQTVTYEIVEGTDEGRFGILRW